MPKWMKEWCSTISIVITKGLPERWFRRRLLYLALHPRFTLQRRRVGRALGRGVRFFHDKKYEEALGAFEESQRTLGRNDNALYFMYEMMATCHQKLGDKEQSKEFAALARESKFAHDRRRAQKRAPEFTGE